MRCQLLVASAVSSAIAVTVSMTAASAALTVMSVASAASMSMDIFTVKPFCEFLFSSLADCHDLTCKVECLSCHLMVEVHLDTVFTHFKHDSGNNRADAVEHRDGVSRNQKVFADFSVHFEC
jgi:hypothetical protein